MVTWRIASLLILSILTWACSPIGPVTRFAEIDRRVRQDFGIPEQVPSPRVVLVDGDLISRLDDHIRVNLMTSGGGIYDPQTHTIYLDRYRYEDNVIFHELVHHYFRFLPEGQVSECLARLYEAYAATVPFPGCSLK